jgi:hypothetical protein
MCLALPKHTKAHVPTQNYTTVVEYVMADQVDDAWASILPDVDDDEVDETEAWPRMR